MADLQFDSFVFNQDSNYLVNFYIAIQIGQTWNQPYSDISPYNLSEYFSGDNHGLFNKTFFFIIYCQFAVNYRILAIYEQIYGQNLAISTNP